MDEREKLRHKYFTDEELEEMRIADAEIEREFAANPYRFSILHGPRTSYYANGKRRPRAEHYTRGKFDLYIHGKLCLSNTNLANIAKALGLSKAAVTYRLRGQRPMWNGVEICRHTNEP